MPRPQRPHFPQHGPDAPWLLDAFCGAGGAGYGYWLAGFNVVGVDIVPQKRYPFTFVQADALEVLAGQVRLGFPFAAAHASPPCEFYSNTQRIMGYDYPALIAPTRDLLAPLGIPYIIENVEGARGELRSPVRLCGAMFPELRVYRHRLFESNIELQVPAHPPHVARQTKMGRAPVEGEFMHVVGNFAGVEQAREAMGISWMGRDELKEAIPPAYTRMLGLQLRKEIMSRTTRAHMPTDRHAARSHTRRKLRTAEERHHKPAKSARQAARTSLREARKEHVR